MANEKSKEKAPGRYKPTYKPSGKGSYNARWRKEERREAAVARQKTLCEQSVEGLGFTPLDWRMMLPKGAREDG